MFQKRIKCLVSLKNYRGVDGMTELEVFVLKDSRGNFVGVNSISYDKQIRKYIYSYSETLSNGYYTYTDELDAKKELNLIQEKGIKIKFGIAFHIERINMLEVSRNEVKLGIVKTYPFKHIVINETAIEPPIVNSVGIKSVLMDYRAMVEVGI